MENFTKLTKKVPPQLTIRECQKAEIYSVCSYGKLRGSSLTYFPGFEMLCLEIVENIDQMH